MIDLLGIDNKMVWALVRVSSNLQDFESQMQGIQSYCKNNNINLFKSFDYTSFLIVSHLFLDAPLTHIID